MELGTEIQVLGGEIEAGTTVGGKIYRAWAGIKDALGGNNKTILQHCEHTEDMVQKAYKSALEDENMPAYLQAILTRQQSILRQAHDSVKAQRDNH